MASLNKVFLMGNLTRDPELRYIPSGTAVCDLGLAINRTYTDKSGQKREDTTFVDITVWGRQGENCNQYLSKGRPVFIEGRLNFSTWENRDGEKRSKLDVVADRVQFLGGRGEGGGDGGGGGSRGGSRGGGGQRGGGAPRGERAAVNEGPPPSDDLDLDDIPF